MNSDGTLDDYDQRILRRLSEDGRITWRDLADEIGLSMTPTVRRVRLLEESGYISGYFARLDEGRLAGTMIVFISVTLERQVRDILDAFEARVADLPEVMSGFLMTGGADYLLRAVVRDLDHYRDLLEDLTQIPGVAHIQSSFALKAFVNRPAPLLAAEGNVGAARRPWMGGGHADRQNRLSRRSRRWRPSRSRRYAGGRMIWPEADAMIAMMFATALAAAMPAAPSSAAGPLVTTTAGTVQGRAVDRVEAFLGIPYGGDTGGANRFLPPRPVAPWAGVRPAVAMGDRCPQLNHKAPLGIIAFSEDPVSENCLVLNVWTPAGKAGKRAVMVWLHGGGFGFGAANDPMYDGAGLARNEGVVVVSLNHRLNGLGYLNLGPEAGPAYADAANVGQRDIVQALQWVRANIARFGADPDNVTLFGQSGGGAKVSLLLATPSARGLFDKAIVESGASVKEQTAEEALALRDALLAKLSLKPADVLKMRDVPIADLSAAIDAVGVLRFKPWIDGRFLPRQPFTPDAPASARGVPLMVGTARDEATALLIANPAWPKMDEPAVRTAIAPLVGPDNADRALSLYKARRPADTPPQIYAAIFTDFAFTHGAQVLATRQAAGGAPVFAYRTDWRTPVLDGALGAPHGVELPFVFDTVAVSSSLVGTQPQPAMVRMFQQTFAGFAKTGTPSGDGLPAWPRYDAARRRTYVYDVKPHVVADPDPALRALWDEVTKEPTVAPTP